VLYDFGQKGSIMRKLSARTGKMIKKLHLPDALPVGTSFQYTSFCPLSFDEIIVAGFYSPTGVNTGDVFSFCVSTGMFSFRGTVPRGRSAIGLIKFRDRLYMFGGFSDSKSEYCDYMILGENEFVELPDLPVSSNWVMGVVEAEVIFITGFFFNHVYRFQTTTETYHTMDITPSKIHVESATKFLVKMGRELYVITNGKGSWRYNIDT
jgi:hypothetical protein